MIAARWDPLRSSDELAKRLAQTLQFAPGRVAASQALGPFAVAQMVRRDEYRTHGWQLARIAGGAACLFNGQLHNRIDLALELGLDGQSPAALVCAAAIEHWGDGADERLIGDYCSIGFVPGHAELRLARSPFTAPPLHYRSDQEIMTAASVARALFLDCDQRPRFDEVRLADAMLINFTDRTRGWYEGTSRVPMGCALRVTPGGAREVWRYDLLSRPAVRFARDEDYVDAAREQLGRGVTAALEGAKSPGIMISGGLDSSIVGATTLARLPAGQLLHGFTYGPAQGWQGPARPGTFNDDRPIVDRFAAMHPAFRAHHFGNDGQDFRHRLRDLVAATGCMPPGLAASWMLHDLYDAARDQGCDVLLCGDFGNESFSNAGSWGFVEYFTRGRWGQLYRALARAPGDDRGLLRKFASRTIMPMLPRPAWSLIKQLVHPGTSDRLAISGMSPGYARDNAVLERARAGGVDTDWRASRSRKAWWQQILLEEGQDLNDIDQGFEQLYGLPARDPTAYRPLVELCYGMPTDQFLRDGTPRWLARRMARGLMPEEQRLNPNVGWQFADWQPRFARARGELLEELDRMADDADIARIIDLPGLRRKLEDFPEQAGPERAADFVLAVAIGMTAGRFIAYTKGRNDI